MDLQNRVDSGKLPSSSIYIQWGLVLRWFILQRFTFTTLAETDRAFLTCGASLSQLKRRFSAQCTSSSFPVCMCPSSRQIILFYKKERKEQGRLTLQTKMLVIRKMEAGGKRANVCSSLGLAVATVMANAEKIKQSF